MRSFFFSQHRVSLLEASSNFVPADAPLSEELFDNPDRIASERGGEMPQNKRHQEQTQPKRAHENLSDDIGPRVVGPVLYHDIILQWTSSFILNFMDQ